MYFVDIFSMKLRKCKHIICFIVVLTKQFQFKYHEPVCKIPLPYYNQEVLRITTRYNRHEDKKSVIILALM